MPPQRHEVDDLADAALGEEARDEHGRARQVELLGREGLAHRLEREAAAVLGVEDRAEQAGGIEALGAEPVDRALVADERDAVQVADDPVVLDRQVAVGGALLLAPVLRRHPRHLGGPVRRRSGAVSRAASAASMAAPTMPAWFCSSAGTHFTRDGSSWMNLSASLLMPPPMITRSGQNSASISSTYSARRLLQACQLRPLRLLDRCGGAPLGVLAAQLQVPELGVRDERAVAEDRRADARAERQHEHRAAPARARRRSASRRGRRRRRRCPITSLRSSASANSVSAGVSIHERSMLAAVLTTPPRITAGKPMPACSCARQVRDEPGRRLDHGLRAWPGGASRRARDPSSSSPLVVSTIAALMPVPPTSMPIISMPACTLRAPARRPDGRRSDARVRD